MYTTVGFVNENQGYESECLRGLGGSRVKLQVSPNQKTLLTKVVRHDKGMVKNIISPSGGARKTREAGFLVNPILKNFVIEWYL